MKPIKDQVVIKPREENVVTAGGIIIPDTAKEKSGRGTVIAVGDGTKDEPMVLKPNDDVLFNKYSGTEVVIDNVNYLVMRQDEVYLILN